jgi:hypothetical protein
MYGDWGRPCGKAREHRQLRLPEERKIFHPEEPIERGLVSTGVRQVARRLSLPSAPLLHPDTAASFPAARYVRGQSLHSTVRSPFLRLLSPRTRAGRRSFGVYYGAYQAARPGGGVGGRMAGAGGGDGAGDGAGGTGTRGPDTHARTHRVYKGPRARVCPRYPPQILGGGRGKAGVGGGRPSRPLKRVGSETGRGLRGLVHAGIAAVVFLFLFVVVVVVVVVVFVVFVVVAVAAAANTTATTSFSCGFSNLDCPRSDSISLFRPTGEFSRSHAWPRLSRDFLIARFVKLIALLAESPHQLLLFPFLIFPLWILSSARVFLGIFSLPAVGSRPLGGFSRN